MNIFGLGLPSPIKSHQVLSHASLTFVNSAVSVPDSKTAIAARPHRTPLIIGLSELRLSQEQKSILPELFCRSSIV